MKAKLSRQGILASLVSLLFLLSLSETTRISFAGLLIHPYLALIPVALIITRFSIFSLSKKILIPLFLYGILLSASVLRELNFGEIVKIFSGILTFLFFAQSVKNEKDFTFISIGFIYLTTPSYLDPLFTTEAGSYLLIIGGTLLALGVTIIIRMTHKDLY